MNNPAWQLHSIDGTVTAQPSVLNGSGVVAPYEGRRRRSASPPGLPNGVPRIAGGQCQVWWAHPWHANERHYSMFTKVERERAAAYRRPIDRDRFIVGCALSRILLGELLDVAPAQVQLDRECLDCGAGHGKPRLVDDSYQLSVSHSGDLVGVAVTQCGPVGLDVEELSARTAPPTELILAPAERHDTTENVSSSFAYWVRKEAFLKATGDGLRVAMTDVHIDLYDDHRAQAAFPGRQPLAFQLHTIATDETHTAALAVLTPAAVSISTYWAGSLLTNEQLLQCWPKTTADRHVAFTVSTLLVRLIDTIKDTCPHQLPTQHLLLAVFDYIGGSPQSILNGSFHCRDRALLVRYFSAEGRHSVSLAIRCRFTPELAGISNTPASSTVITVEK